ncbi:DUF2325 domain-containing protein [Clostridium sp. 19966]|uniref:DUF2325 domain-containing protein n=1 Tax=Clostridium sp. 19966 TaxID=2768166 RepID=UPI0028DDB221|nr:DUF2325 domain-containing protein [Clostridium sp. 19966]MDT8719574.1 DUF2325 domain-containing protein [Clostridium sp. 19966]
MNALIIGGDNLGTIENKLKQKGFENIQHITGRKDYQKINEKMKGINIDLIIILVDYINHSVMHNVKKASKKMDAKTIFTKRSWVYIENHINEFISLKN